MGEFRSQRGEANYIKRVVRHHLNHAVYQTRYTQTSHSVLGRMAVSPGHGPSMTYDASQSPSPDGYTNITAHAATPLLKTVVGDVVEDCAVRSPVSGAVPSVADTVPEVGVELAVIALSAGQARDERIGVVFGEVLDKGILPIRYRETPKA